MKKLLLILSLCTSMGWASHIENPGGGVSVYPTTATASFPFGASFSTVSASGVATSTVTASSATFTAATIPSLTLNTLNGVIPGLIAGTNISSISGAWPNQTINATAQSTVLPSSAIAFGSASNTVTSDTNSFTWNNTTKKLSLIGDGEIIAIGNGDVIASKNGIGFYISGSNSAEIFKENYSGLCSDLSTSCTTVPITLDFPSGTSKFFFNNDGRFFAYPSGTRYNAYSSVVGGSLIVGGTSGFNYTDTQKIGDGNLFVNRGVVASTLTITNSGAGTQTVIQSTVKPYLVIDENQANSPAGEIDFTTLLATNTVLKVDGTGFHIQSSTQSNANLVTDRIVVVEGVTPSVQITTGTFTITQLPSALVATNSSGVAISTTVDLGASNVGGTLAAGRFPALTGDATTSAGSLATTLASIVTANQYGSSTVVPVVTFDSKGRITAVSSATISASGGGGTNTLGISSGAATNSVVVSSPTSNVVFDSNTINVALQGTTTSFISLTSSVTKQGVITASSLGALTGNQSITLSGDGSGSGTTAITVTNAASQANIKTFTSSITVTGAGGITNTYGITSGTGTFYTTVASSNALVVQSTNNVTVFAVSNSSVTSGDFMLNVSTVPGGSGPMAFGVNTYGHVVSSGVVPSVSSCGTSPSMNGNSTDFAGEINVGSVTATACTLTFANAFINPPVCVISDDSTGVTADITSISTTAAVFGFSVSLAGGHVWYICVGSKG